MLYIYKLFWKYISLLFHDYNNSKKYLHFVSLSLDILPFSFVLTLTRLLSRLFQILKQLNISPVVIIQGPTGCGKTTQVPQYILDFHQSRGTYCNIVVTQPRKIAAISIARRVCHERKWQLGTIVGYQVWLICISFTFVSNMGILSWF